MREKLNKLQTKGIYMVFMRGSPGYPACKNSLQLMQLFRKHYSWVINNPLGNDDLELEFYDVT